MPKHTMNGLEINDSMSANGSLHICVLRTMLRSHLSHLQPALYRIVSDSMTRIFQAGKNLPGDWTELNSFSLAKDIITGAHSRAFFGESLSSSPEFLKAALDYPEDLFRTSEVLRLLPTVLAPLVSPILMRHHRASSILVEYLTVVIELRLKQTEKVNPEVQPIDCIQFFLDANSKRGAWTTHRLIQVLLGVWFAALHQPALSLTYALDDLCEHPEYIVFLRKELGTCDITAENIDRFPIMDSFLKESARLHPSDSISVRRKVLRPFRFSDGTSLFPGDVACVPLQAIMIDPSNYDDSTRFDGHRFVDKMTKANISRFTDASSIFPLWGLGKHGWYVLRSSV